MRKITRSIYHKKVKQIDSNQKRIKKTRIAKGFLENRSRDFWSEISKIRRKTHITPCTVEGFSNNEDISSCFSSYYKDLYNSVSLIQLNGQNYTKLLTIRFVMNVLIILSMLMMSKMPLTNWNLAKATDLMALHLIISLMHLLCVLCIYHIYLLPCYINVLPQNPYVIPLWSQYQKVQTKIHLISKITEA